MEKLRAQRVPSPDAALAKERHVLAKHYPELDVAGYTSVDGTIEFYGRVNALLSEAMTVLDFGAGRGAWFEDDECSYRKAIRLLKGKVRRVIGCDVDPSIFSNRSVDASFVFAPGEALQLDDESVDLIVTDYVLEHVDDPQWLSRELERILKPNGWICARTPSKWSYVALASRLAPNRIHSAILGHVQQTRHAHDVFPTRYRLNTIAALRRAFSPQRFEHFSYYYSGEPSYHFGSSTIFSALRFIEWLLPNPFHANLFVFLRKRGPRDD